MLPSFEITNFRTFSHLRIERLGRVNLIAGRNNVGKTTLLEALHLYAAENPCNVIREDLTDHDELLLAATSEDTRLDYRSLFHGRQFGSAKITLGSLGETGAEDRLVIELLESQQPEGEVVPEVGIRRGSGSGTRCQPRGPERLHSPEDNVVYVIAGEVPSGILTHWWDSIAGTDYEDEAIASMSVIAPLELVRLVQDPTRVPGRVFVVRQNGEDEPVPLKSLGGGAFRMFQIATAIAYSARLSTSRQQSHKLKTHPLSDRAAGERATLLLIDEIENGIHYTLHAKLWEFIFGLAQRLNLQVFATSHSWDCIKGFQKALAADKEADGLVIRLERKEDVDKARAVVIDPEDLPIVTRESIEVR